MRYLLFLTLTSSQYLLASCQSSSEANSSLGTSTTKIPYILGGVLSIIVVILAIVYIIYRGWRMLAYRKEHKRRVQLALEDRQIHASRNDTELPQYSIRASQVTLPSSIVETLSVGIQLKSYVSPPPPIYSTSG
ncbi:hypothetical protein K7432_005316 [Basidiobolus ranarum]|uniref:Uncharacterized protein n=1 Tax=Basidiobolus ranarum TaxID=34480 RepID=A0ABR2W3I2_9FUNG